jgi:hypothetical protein
VLAPWLLMKEECFVKTKNNTMWVVGSQGGLLESPTKENPRKSEMDDLSDPQLVIRRILKSI